MGRGRPRAIIESPEELVGLHKQEFTLRDIGKKYCCTERRVANIFNKIGYKYKKPLKEQILEQCLKENTLLLEVKNNIYYFKCSKGHLYNRKSLSLYKNHSGVNNICCLKCREESIPSAEEQIKLHKQGWVVDKIARTFRLTDKVVTDGFTKAGYNYFYVNVSPNSFEIECLGYLNKKYPNKFKYVGDGSSIINKRNPDFISKELKTVVLANGCYWHLTKKGYKITKENKKIVENYEALPFLDAGYKVIFIWEDEIDRSLK